METRALPGVGRSRRGMAFTLLQRDHPAAERGRSPGRYRGIAAAPRLRRAGSLWHLFEDPRRQENGRLRDEVSGIYAVGRYFVLMDTYAAGHRPTMISGLIVWGSVWRRAAGNDRRRPLPLKAKLPPSIAGCAASRDVTSRIAHGVRCGGELKWSMAPRCHAPCPGIRSF